MIRYHINTKTGNPGICHAQANECPFRNILGEESQHYKTEEEARKAYETIMSETEEKMSSKEELDTIKTPETETLIKYLQEYSEKEYQVHRTITALQLIADNQYVSNLLKLIKNIELYHNATNIIKKIETNTESYATIYGWKERRHNIKKEIDFLKNELRKPIKTNNLQDAMARLLQKPEETEIQKILQNPQKYDTQHQKNLVQKINDGANNFIKNFTEIPEKYSKKEIPGFTYINSGQEQIVYKENSTVLIYKIPHSKSLKYSLNNTIKENNLIKNFKTEKTKYSQIDTKLLSQYNAEYIKTLYILKKTTTGKTIPIIIQPYLNKKYVPYTPTLEEETIFEKAGLSDLSSKNILLNPQSRKLIFIDCLYTK